MGKGAWTAALLVAVVVVWGWSQQHERAPGPAVAVPALQAPARSDSPAFLPPQALDTLASIHAGGPFAHRQDGGVFQNRERRLPSQPRGYYREYTVETPGSGDRGARRIVAGGDPPVEFFYTDDHYRTFRRFEWDPQR
jgi:guanyl-specific ribonuclease Sa